MLAAVAVVSFVLGIIWAAWMIARDEAREAARRAEYMQQVYEAICNKYNIPVNTFRDVEVPDGLPEDL